MQLLDLLHGFLVACCWVAALFFFRFFRSTRDRLFLFFAVGFWVFSLNWLGVALLGGPTESRHLLYLLRLMAFGLILAGIYDKNRRERPFVRVSPLVARASDAVLHQGPEEQLRDKR